MIILAVRIFLSSLQFVQILPVPVGNAGSNSESIHMTMEIRGSVASQET